MAYRPHPTRREAHKRPRCTAEDGEQEIVVRERVTKSPNDFAHDWNVGVTMRALNDWARKNPCDSSAWQKFNYRKI